jgi:hypothetical protein
MRAPCTGSYRPAGSGSKPLEPIDSQALVAAGIVVRQLADGPVRHVQAALLQDKRAPATRAVLDLVR